MKSKKEIVEQQLINLQQAIKDGEQQLQNMHLKAIYYQGQIAAFHEIEDAAPGDQKASVA